jgi:NAD-dependent dihydropyrimidine dehydrogenase PreA subunit
MKTGRILFKVLQWWRKYISLIMPWYGITHTLPEKGMHFYSTNVCGRRFIPPNKSLQNSKYDWEECILCCFGAFLCPKEYKVRLE